MQTIFRIIKIYQTITHNIYKKIKNGGNTMINNIIINGEVINCNGYGVVILKKDGGLEIKVDGEVIREDAAESSKVIINGNVEKIECNGNVEVRGDVNDVKCNGDCVVSGSVNGAITAEGSVICEKAKGPIYAGRSVRCGK